MTIIKVTGNSYKAKQVLKDAGFKWNSENKCWTGTPEDVTEFERITNPTYSRSNQNVVTEYRQGAYQTVVKFEEMNENEI